MPNFISLFSGAGGLDLGLERAGWHCLFACDNDSAAVGALKANRERHSVFRKTTIRQVDIARLSAQEILESVGRKAGEIDLLAGGPPCQSWSSAGLQLGFADPRGQLVNHYIRLAQELQTNWLLFENVRGLVTARGPSGRPGEALEIIRRRLLDEAGFQTQVTLFNSADYGLPQRRVRVILQGYKTKETPPIPVATHSKYPNTDGKLRGWVSLGDCIESLPAPKDEEIERPSPKLLSQLKALKPGMGVKSPGKKETTRPGGHWGYKQGAFLADPRKPARTVTASSQQDWIIDKARSIRRLTVRETSALQSFPSDWIFSGSRSDQRRLVGNAVPPLIAEAIGKALITFSRNRQKQRKARFHGLTPLPVEISRAIEYTEKEELRNGVSRVMAPAKRRSQSTGRVVISNGLRLKSDDKRSKKRGTRKAGLQRSA